jgi:hypothetical protein
MFIYHRVTVVRYHMVLYKMACVHEELFGEAGHMAQRLLTKQFCFVSAVVKSKLIKLSNLVKCFSYNRVQILRSPILYLQYHCSRE